MLWVFEHFKMLKQFQFYHSQGLRGLGSFPFGKKNGRGIWLSYSFQGVYLTLSKLSTCHEFHCSIWKYRWHSPYTLVYKDPLLTYLFVISKPSILTFKINQIVYFWKLANFMFKFYQPIKGGYKLLPFFLYTILVGGWINSNKNMIVTFHHLPRHS